MHIDIGDFMEHRNSGSYPIEEALRAQKALRDLAGLAPEAFPLEAFVGMISDEIETLCKQGRSDDEIAQTISGNSKIAISVSEIASFYASPEERGHSHE
jgi:hypothetical protein